MLVLGTESEVIYIYTATPNMIDLILNEVPSGHKEPCHMPVTPKLPSSDPLQQELRERSLDHTSLKVDLASPRVSIHLLKID